MRPRPLYLALLCLALFVFSCSNSDEPTQIVTSPGDALHDAVGIAVNTCPQMRLSRFTWDLEEDAYKPELRPSVIDPDEDDVHSLIVTVQPVHGFVQINPGYAYYQADQNYCGLDSLTIKVNDGTCDSDEAVIVITIECENDCPTGDHNGISVNQNGSVNFQLEGEDPDDQVPGGGEDLRITALLYSVAQAPAHGTLVVQGATGAASYTPAAGYYGPDAFTYTVGDGECTSSPYTININVIPLVVDSDDDGVPDDQDDCDFSLTSETIFIEGCDSGVPNLIGGQPTDATGCTLADHIREAADEAAATATNHGKFVSAMSRSLKALAATGAFSQDDLDELMHCVGSSDVQKAH